MSAASATLPGTLFVFGAGGFGREVAWLARDVLGEAHPVTFLVDRPEYVVPRLDDSEGWLLGEQTFDVDSRCVIAVGDPAGRESVSLRCAAAGLSPYTLVHPRAEMSKRVQIGDGTVVCAGVIITTSVVIGRHVHVNLATTIGHDVVVGDFTTIAPGVNVSGNVHIGRGVYLGTGATIINGSAESPLVIGDGSVVAAGACVIRDVSPHSLVAGVPAIQKR
jgi:sugar O-acyltransferase (sialic acid O-acetyltransferase NeuD family)